MVASPRRTRALAWALIGASLCLTACAVRRSPVHRELASVASRDALAVSDALEALIAAGRDTPADREYAYTVVKPHQEDTAAATFARAAVTGRWVQQQGLFGAHLVPDVERAARRSRELDPDFRDGAATRLLGTLYVIAPGPLLENGDSEQGLELLQELVAKRPDVPENRLRLAEAYIALGDFAPAGPHVCACLAHATMLRLDDQALLRQLVLQLEDDGGPVACGGSGGSSGLTGPTEAPATPPS